MCTTPKNRFVKVGFSSLWLAPELAPEPDLAVLADPDALFARPGCEIVKDQKKIKVGRLALEIGGAWRRVYVKRYNVFSWRYRLSSLWRPSGAARAWVGASLLLESGFHTGKPLAAVEYRRRGLLSKSFYLSEEIPAARTADDYWRQELRAAAGVEGLRRRRGFLARLAELFRALHGRGLYHNDLKDANILIRPDGDAETFYLLDLEGIRRYRSVSRRRRIKNIVQLNRTLGRLMRQPEKLFWLKVYLGKHFANRNKRRQWIRRILAESRRRDRRSLRKSRQ